jgi:hypothetical protein
VTTGALGPTPTLRIYGCPICIAFVSSIYTAVPFPIRTPCARLAWSALQPGACMYLGQRAGGYIPHSTSRVIRHCIDLCALLAADPLDPGPLRALTSPISFGSPPRARSCLRSLTVFVAVSGNQTLASGCRRISGTMEGAATSCSGNLSKKGVHDVVEMLSISSSADE